MASRAGGNLFQNKLPPVRKADIEFTSRCNLRCTYCTVSLPGDVGEDLEATDDMTLLSDLKRLGVTHVTLNGRGETTTIKNWVTRLKPFVEAFETRIISNLARTYMDDELELFARIGRIDVSFDSTNRRVMSLIRRRANPDVLISNIVRIRMAALKIGLPSPTFTIGSGIYDHNVAGLPDLARLAVTLGVGEVNFWNLVKHDDLEGATNVRPLTALAPREQREALESIDECIAIIRTAGIAVNFSGDFVDAFRRFLTKTGSI